jgi:crotonobetainyl-CoA:carnitine CoA-transferase CaiB-like acyl-CoA transferase
MRACSICGLSGSAADHSADEYRRHSGVNAATAIGFALLYRERTGKGQFIETSLLDCYFSYHDSAVELISASHGTMKPYRNGSHHYLICPVGIFSGRPNPILIIAGADRPAENIANQAMFPYRHLILPLLFSCVLILLFVIVATG